MGLLSEFTQYFLLKQDSNPGSFQKFKSYCWAHCVSEVGLEETYNVVYFFFCVFFSVMILFSFLSSFSVFSNLDSAVNLQAKQPF